MVAQTDDSSDTVSLVGWLERERHDNQWQPETEPAVAVSIDALVVADSPRIAGESEEHLNMLAAVQDELPPIIVHRPTMRVIDGVHRMRVAKARGDHQILARFFSGDDADAFVIAVKSNITHGLPLTLADRRGAAIRILSSHQHWSDRRIASVTGLAARTVAEIRRRCEDEFTNVGVRMGQDGRVRPVNGAAGRVLAHQLMTDNPELSLRKIAQAAGISPETARDVRKRLQQGKDPVPDRIAKKKVSEGCPPESERAELGDRADRKAGRVRAPSERLGATVERLKADPALRFTETGRKLLRLLHLQLVETADWEKICANVPAHCSVIIADLAQECAEMWLELSSELERKAI
jgi:hypothetical protein